MRFEAHIDAISPEGRIDGWAADWGAQTPCQVRIESGGYVIGEAVACHFRHDLLQGGLGHGHYAFSAWCRPEVLPGTYEVALIDARSAEAYWPSEHAPLTIPDTMAPPESSVATLLAPSPHWTDEQVLAQTACLQLDENMTSMGVDRFVDVTYHYVLGRWADAAGGGSYASRLDEGTISTRQFFLELMVSEERRAILQPLPGPYHSRFPYRLAYRRRVARAETRAARSA